MVHSNLPRDEEQNLKKLLGNLKKIMSKEKFILKINNSYTFSLELIELVYKFDLPITLEWTGSKSKKIYLRTLFQTFLQASVLASIRMHFRLSTKK